MKEPEDSDLDTNQDHLVPKEAKEDLDLDIITIDLDHQDKLQVDIIDLKIKDMVQHHKIPTQTLDNHMIDLIIQKRFVMFVEKWVIFQEIVHKTHNKIKIKITIKINDET